MLNFFFHRRVFLPSFLGFIGDGRSRLAGEQQFPSGLSVAAGLPFLMAACIGDSNVLTQIQESVMERQ